MFQTYDEKYVNAAPAKSGGKSGSGIGVRYFPKREGKGPKNVVFYLRKDVRVTTKIEAPARVSLQIDDVEQVVRFLANPNGRFSIRKNGSIQVSLYGGVFPAWFDRGDNKQVQESPYYESEFGCLTFRLPPEINDS